jgi:transaldolase
MTKKVSDLKVKIFADGADKAGMLEIAKHPYVKGFTTNPTLMNRAGIRDYEAFAHDILASIPDRSISFEVFSDDFDDMKRQALKIAQWGKNVYVKIPVMNTKAEYAYDLIRSLAKEGVKQNVTALMTLEQVRDVKDALGNEVPSYVSVFAGRIADTGIDPMLIMRESVAMLPSNQELIWASPRELLNIFQADDIGCHIITATNDIIKKLELVNKDLNQYSLETVKMFYSDAQKAGFEL